MTRRPGDYGDWTRDELIADHQRLIHAAASDAAAITNLKEVLRMKGLSVDERAARTERVIITGNGWPARLRALSDFVQKPGGMAMLFLAFCLAVYTGYIPSETTALAGQLRAHDASHASLAKERLEVDRQVAEALKGIHRVISDRERRDRLRECEAIKDADLRRECLR